jgi:hypothetical protein
VFSKEVTVPARDVFAEPPLTAQDNMFEATKLPTEAVDEVVRTLPSLETTIGIIVISAALAFSILWIAKKIFEKKALSKQMPAEQ